MKPDTSIPIIPAKAEAASVLCINCKHVRKNKDDYDYMCTQDKVAGMSLVTGTVKTMMCWLARSNGGMCGSSGKYYEQAANPNSSGQAQSSPAPDAPPSKDPVLSVL